MEGPKFILKLPASNKRKKKKISPRTSPRILTEDAIDILPKRQGGKEEKEEEGGGVRNDVQPAITVSSITSQCGTATTVLEQLRRGSVEQTIKSFEKLHTTD